MYIATVAIGKKSKQFSEGIKTSTILTIKRQNWQNLLRNRQTIKNCIKIKILEIRIRKK